MRKGRKKLTLSRETVASLALPEPHLEKAAGGCYGSDYGSCLTDGCSVAYCVTKHCH